MTSGFYQKISGAWTNVGKPYVRDPSTHTWVGAIEAYKKTSGVWVKDWQVDNTPSSPPQVVIGTVSSKAAGPYSVKDNNSNYLRIGVRLPGSTHDTGLKMIRVLSTYAGAAPTSQYGGTYTATPDSSFPLETWSDFYYNGWGPDGTQRDTFFSAARNTTTLVFKEWPVNASSGTKLPAGLYYFAAWSLDEDGNWSQPTYTAVNLNAWGGSAEYVDRSQFMYPFDTGSYNTTLGVTAHGDLYQVGTDHVTGYFLYGTQINDSFNGTLSLVQAQILLYRAVDSGDASANVTAYFSGIDTASQMDALAPGTELTPSGLTVLGTIAKGEAKWFNLPSTWFPYFDTTLRSIHLWYQSAVLGGPVSADYSQISGQDVQVRSGLLAFTWRESS